ncbi:MAG: class I adenylate-forming enzyme family protein [Gammaproteobacteria bacterium]
MRLPERLARVLELAPDSQAIEFGGRWRPWRYLSTLTRRIDEALTRAGIGAAEAVGLMASNRPTVVAGVAALLITRRCVVIVNPNEPDVRLADELSRLRLKAFMADAADWHRDAVVKALAATGTLGLVLDDDAQSVSLHPGLENVGAGPHRAADARIVLDQTTSGTTGPPRRSTSTLERLEQLLAGGHPEGRNENPENLKVQRSAAIAFKSIAHSGGCTSILLALYEARPISLHEKFAVDTWVDAVKRHRPKVSSLVPAMVQMVWDANVPRSALESLIAIRTGTAPLDRSLKRNFEERYGIPLLVDYGSTETGAITAWSLADHGRYRDSKEGSVGRTKRGIRVRVVDDATGRELEPGSTGVLEVHNPLLSPDWIRTTDLASLDADGFLFIHGRADGAIVRGGFKVLPEIVAQALRQHALVRDAAVVGIADVRLGQVPVAFVEPHAGRARPAPADLEAHLRQRLPAYQVPVRITVLDALPRTASMKVDLGELRASAGKCACANTARSPDGAQVPGE